METGRAASGAEYSKQWVQRLIAAGLMMGIGKRELLENYYPGELQVVMEEWNRLHKPPEETVETDPMAFFGVGGEIVE